MSIRTVMGYQGRSTDVRMSEDKLAKRGVKRVAVHAVPGCEDKVS